MMIDTVTVTLTDVTVNTVCVLLHITQVSCDADFRVMLV